MLPGSSSFSGLFVSSAFSECGHILLGILYHHFEWVCENYG